MTTPAQEDRGRLWAECQRLWDEERAERDRQWAENQRLWREERRKTRRRDTRLLLAAFVLCAIIIVMVVVTIILKAQAVDSQPNMALDRRHLFLLIYFPTFAALWFIHMFPLLFDD